MALKKMEDMTEPELKELFNALALVTEAALRLTVEGMPMFTLLVFNDPKVTQYVSNCKRPEMIEALKEVTARLEAKEDVPR